MIGVLRAGEGPAETTPTQGTDRMGDLVSYLEGADIEVTLDETAYDRACVPVFIDVALFGIAREAATNIVRHAGARRATLALSTKREGFAELVVDDDGKGSLPGCPRPVTTACSACASARGFCRARSPHPQARSAACALL